MKKSILILMAIATSAFGQTKTKNFRNASWGMTVPKVIALEKKAKLLIEDENIITYSGVVAGHKADIHYTFTNGKLFQGSYSFQDNHLHKLAYVFDYKKLKSLLTKKYGVEPIQDKVTWKDNRFKSDHSKLGYALLRGDVEYSAVWETSSTSIVLTLTGDGKHMHHELLYYNKKLKKFAEQLRVKEESDGL
ncbi:hypothetical protein N9901_03155 [Flavobacteriaceae bacterium]|nr:hypothetical protein [Flavobacteriaceae bacterium]